MNPDFALALSRLPHGPEFRFLDRIIELTPGQTGVGEYTIRGDEAFLRGHFPSDPIFPGVLLIEAAAQLAGCVAQSDPRISPLPGLKLAAVHSAKILAVVRPGQTIRLTAAITARLANLIQATATATLLPNSVTPMAKFDSQDNLILQCEITLAGAAVA